MRIFKSFILLQQEKLIVIKKELRHLWYIANYYNYKEIDTSIKNEQTQRVIIASIICKEIECHLEYISTLDREIINNKKHTMEIILFLSLYDKKNYELSELLKIVKLIQSKLSQFLQDHFNQYLPIPMTTKRYSSKGFLDYIKEFHNSILNSLDKNIDPPIILWSHTMSFRANPSLYKENKAHYIEMAYWYYEIPFLLPTITHELGHILLQSKNNNLIKDIKGIFKENKEINDFFTNDGEDSFLDEIICDMLGYIVHGKSYLMVMVHELLGKDFSRNFLNENNKLAIKPIDIYNKQFTESLIRIFLILEFQTMFDNEEKKDDKIEIEEIKKIINHLITPLNYNIEYKQNLNKTLQKLSSSMDDIEPSLAYLYTVIYPNLMQNYKNFHLTISESIFLIYENSLFDIKSLGEKLTEIINSLDNNKIKKLRWLKLTLIKIPYNFIISKINDKLFKLKNTLTFPEIFNILYSNRIESINYSISKNRFRELILDTDNLKKISKERNDKIGKPYELTLFKTRTDVYKNQDDYFDILSKSIDSLYFNTPNYKKSNRDIYFTFDLFTALTIVEKKNKLNQEEIDNFLDYEKIDNSQGVFFTYKYSLIKLWEKEEEKKSKNNLYFNTIMQIQLTQNDSITTEKGRWKLINYFKDKEYGVEIFKALGPKELIINCKKIDIDTIFTLKEEIIELSNVFRRTYTIIYGDSYNLKSFNSNETYSITTTLRLKSTTPLNKIIHKNIKYKFYLTGVTDIQLIWKDETSIDDIFNFYNHLTKQAYTSDIQTKIVKNI